VEASGAGQPGSGFMTIDVSAFVHFEPSSDFSTVTLHFQRPDESMLEITMPLESISQAAPEILRMCLASQQAKISSDAAASGYVRKAFSSVATAEVGADAKRARVLLTFDRDTPKQVAYAFPPSGAKSLGEGLVNCAEMCLAEAHKE
jgi:hypothetical protein